MQGLPQIVLNVPIFNIYYLCNCFRRLNKQQNSQFDPKKKEDKAMLGAPKNS
jgi:hypothetical protein